MFAVVGKWPSKQPAFVSEQMCMVVSRPYLAIRIRHHPRRRDIRCSGGVARRNERKGQPVVPNEPFAGGKPEIAVSGLRDRVDIASGKSRSAIPNIVTCAEGDRAPVGTQSSARQENE